MNNLSKEMNDAINELLSLQDRKREIDKECISLFQKRKKLIDKGKAVSRKIQDCIRGMEKFRQ